MNSGNDVKLKALTYDEAHQAAMDMGLESFMEALCPLLDRHTLIVDVLGLTLALAGAIQQIREQKSTIPPIVEELEKACQGATSELVGILRALWEVRRREEGCPP